MARPCKCCNHPDRKKIDIDLHSEIPIPDVSNRYGVSKSSIWRHKQHMDDEILPPMEEVRKILVANSSPIYPAESLRKFVDVSSELTKLFESMQRALSAAETSMDVRDWVASGREMRATLETIGKLYGLTNGDGTSVELAEMQRGMERFKEIVMSTVGPECREKIKMRLAEIAEYE